MAICKTRKWGNSIGVIIPNDIVREMGISENQDVNIEISKKGRVILRELWDFGTNSKKISKDRFLKLRKELESKYN